MEALHPVAAALGVAVSVVEPGAVASESVRTVDAGGAPAGGAPEERAASAGLTPRP